MASKDLILRELARLNVHYDSNKGPAELRVLSETWGEDLEDLTDKDLLAALKSCRRKYDWFPKSSQVLKAAQELEQHPVPSDAPALPEVPCRMTEEDLTRNKVGARRILDLMAERKRRELEEEYGVEGPTMSQDERERLREQSARRAEAEAQR